MITLALKALGLMRVSEHEAVNSKLFDAELKIGRLQSHLDVADRTIGKLYNERDDWKAKHASSVGKLSASETKFKRAATDLAAQAEEIAAYKEGAKALHRGLDEYMDEITAQKGLVGALTDKNVELVGKLETARGERDAAMTDAQKWRDYLKRSRDRKAGRK